MKSISEVTETHVKQKKFEGRAFKVWKVMGLYIILVANPL
jgi:hypothetical protein